MLYRFFTTFCLLLASLLALAADGRYFQVVDVKDGLADNFVRDIYRDSRGYVWLSTLNGLSRYDGHRMVNYLPRRGDGMGSDVSWVRETADGTLWVMCGGRLCGDSLLVSMGISGQAQSLHVDDDGNLWVATPSGLYHYDYAARHLVHIATPGTAVIRHIATRGSTALVVTTDQEVLRVLPDEHRLQSLGRAPTAIRSRDSRVLLDDHMQLWLYDSHSPAGTQWIFSLKSGRWRQADELRQMGDVLVNAIATDRDDNLWVGTGNAGIHLFRHHCGRTGDVAYRLADDAPLNAFASHSCHITCFYLDATNTMWVGSAKLGAAFTDLGAPDFDRVDTGGYDDVSALLEDRQGRLWVGLDGGGVLCADGSGQHYSARRQQLPSDIVTSLAMLPDGTLLAGTYGSGIARFDGQRFVPYGNSREGPLQYVKALATDANGSLWVATVDKGVARIDVNGRMVNFTADNSELPSDGTLALVCDSLNDIIYIGTSMGVTAYDYVRGCFVLQRQLQPLRGEYVSSLMVCRCGLLWVGSRGGLWVYSQRDDTLQHFTTDDGLSNNTVRALAASGDVVWASTANGLTAVVRQRADTGQLHYSCRPFYDSDGLHQVTFSNNAALTTAAGSALLGSYSGYVRVSSLQPWTPSPASTGGAPLTVRFTGLRINGEEPPSRRAVLTADGLGAMGADLAALTLDYGERPTIFVSAMLPTQSQKVKYAFRFKGDDSWTRIPNNMLYLATLPSGHHLLEVKAVLPGMAESSVAQLPINVRPPLWRSLPALLVYVLLALAVLYLLLRMVQRKIAHERDFELMRMNLRRYEMEEEKIRFFTNIGHDLKTPLTLVLAPLEKIRSAQLPAALRTELDVAWRHARQLQDLVLELLDFRRLDVGKEQLNMKHGDIAQFVRQTVQGFSFYAPRKQIALSMELPPNAVETDFDENKLRRIITNLLSNAYKYNVQGGTVAVRLTDAGTDIQLSVADSGIGIRDKQHVFDRFVQETHGREQEGSGLGLFIVRQYVDMMGGTVSIADNHPQGTVITVTLPMAKAAAVSAPADTALRPAASQAAALPTILLVDDNEEALFFLQRCLDDEYRVLTAANGREALALLGQHADEVSIVVTDVMMPVMDGIQLFRAMKADINYSHLPVVLLTAKSSEENIVEGLREGAADYITKPFSIEVLRLRLRKLLEWSRTAHDKVATGVDIKPSEITVSSLDEELVAHVIALVEQHIDDADYTVAQLSSDVGMTRGHLYKKLMAITGKSPLEFIRVLKLKRGKSLLDQGRTNISEVADRVGLSPKQFAHIFKTTYGTTPTEYLRKRK